MKKYHCYSPTLHSYLQWKGIQPIGKATNKHNEKWFFVYEQTQELSEALSIYRVHVKWRVANKKIDYETNNDYLIKQIKD